MDWHGYGGGERVIGEEGGGEAWRKMRGHQRPVESSRELASVVIENGVAQRRKKQEMRRGK